MARAGRTTGIRLAARIEGGDPWRPVDLERESGVRIVAREAGPRLYGIVMVVHHALCDGIAACEFMGDVWALYAGIEPPGLSGPPPRVGAESEPRHGPTAFDTFGEAMAFTRFFPMPLARARVGGAATLRAAAYG